MHYFRHCVIDWVVCVVVEQVYTYSSQFLSVKKYKKSVPWNASFLPLNTPKNAFLLAGLRPDPLGELTASLQRSPNSLTGLRGGLGLGTGKGGRGRGRKGKGKKEMGWPSNVWSALPMNAIQYKIYNHTAKERSYMNALWYSCRICN